jgi:hypothetical protein
MGISQVELHVLHNMMGDIPPAYHLPLTSPSFKHSTINVRVPKVKSRVDIP